MEKKNTRSEQKMIIKYGSTADIQDPGRFGRQGRQNHSWVFREVLSAVMWALNKVSQRRVSCRQTTGDSLEPGRGDGRHDELPMTRQATKYVVRRIQACKIMTIRSPVC